MNLLCGPDRVYRPKQYNVHFSKIYCFIYSFLCILACWLFSWALLVFLATFSVFWCCSQRQWKAASTISSHHSISQTGKIIKINVTTLVLRIYYFTFFSFHLIFAILEVIRTEQGDVYEKMFNHEYFFPLLHYPLYRVSICGSIFLIIGVSVERYLAVCRPHHYREVQGRSNRVIMYILPALLLAMAINVTKFLEVESFSFCEDFNNCGCGNINQ